MDGNWISVGETAARMGVSEREVRRMVDSFRLASIEEEDGRVFVRADGLTARGGERESGRAGETAEDEDDSRTDDEGEVDSNSEHEHEHEHEDDSGPERWITGFEAAGRIGVTKVQLGNLAMKGLVRRERDYAVGMGRARGRGKGQPGYVYLEADVERIVKLRVESLELRVDSRKGVFWYGNRNGISNFRFQISNSRLKKDEIENCKLKIENCKLVAVPSRRVVDAGDSGWVGCKVAAQILGVCSERMADLTRRGALPVYQRKPGQRGSRLYFRVADVERLAVRQEHVSRRERLLHGEQDNRWGGEQATSGFPTGAFGNDDLSLDIQTIENCKLQIDNCKLRRRRRFVPEWEEKRLAEYDPLSPSPLTTRDYGEFYTVRQVAQMLGVTTGRVREMRKSGRLRGEQRPARYWNHKWRGREPTKGTSRWWFFKKEDVHALQADPAYCNGRRAFEKSLTAEARAARFARQFPSEEEIWEYWKMNRFGREPRGETW